MNRQTLDIEDEADHLESDIADIEADIADLVGEARELDGSDDPDDQERLAQVEEEYDELEVQRVTYQGYVDILREHAEEWDGTEITLQELSAADVRHIRDEARRDAESQGFDYTPKGFLELRMAEGFVAATPPGAPDPSDVGDLPDRLFNWLYGRGNALNTVGDLDLGNLSLRERLMEPQ